MLQEALRSGLPVKTIFITERLDLPAWLPRGIELLRLPDDVFASAVDTQHPQGIAALLLPPVWHLEAALGPRNRVPLLLVAAGLQDPGNLGTLIRSAEAFGATGVLTTPGTVSEWNQKTLRASAGSAFRVPTVQVTCDEVEALKLRGVRLFAAVAPDARATSNNARGRRGMAPVVAAEADLAGPCALLIGNEGAGLAIEWLRIADAPITIPMPGHVESLNAAVAGSLLLYEASRQRAASELTD
jgi:TrmH family RNA methyltransferase